MILTGETEVKGETPVPVSLCSPQQKKTTEEHVTSFGAGQDKLQSLLYQQSAIFVKTIHIQEPSSLL